MPPGATRAALLVPAAPAAAQSLAMRPASMEIEGMSVAEFARSLQVYSADGEPAAAVCMATVYDSEGNAWSSWASDDIATVGGGEAAACWSAEVSEMIPDGRLVASDRLLSPGLIMNTDYLTAHAQPVTTDHPIDPFIISDELRFSTPNFDGAVEEVGRPMENPYRMGDDHRWVALSFVLVPMADRRHDGDSGGPLSEEFESRPVTVLLGSRER